MQLIPERIILIGPIAAEQGAQTFAQLLLGHPVEMSYEIAVETTAASRKSQTHFTL